MPPTNRNGNKTSGACLCGAVRFTVREPLRSIVFCHCSQCRRAQGPFAAYTAASRESVELNSEAGLKWFDSSARAQRGFCRVCGSSLFWVPVDESYWGIAVGALDPSCDLERSSHIFVADKASYYDILDDLPQFPGSQRGLGR